MPDEPSAIPLADVLRAANDLARLPVEARPADWLSVLSSVYDLLPSDSECPGIFEARVFLNG